MKGASLEASIEYLADELAGWAALYDTGIVQHPVAKERGHTYRVLAKLLREMVDESRPLPVGSDG